MAIEWGLRDAPVLWYAALRAVLTGAVLVAVGTARRRPTPSLPRDWGWIVGLGLTNVTVAFAAMFAGVAGGTTGGAALVGLAMVVEGAPAIAWTPRFVLSLLFLAWVGTAGTTVAWFVEVRRSRFDQLTAWTFLTPVVGVALAVAVLGERPAGWTGAGLVVVLIAMWVVLRPAAARFDAGGEPHV